MKIAFLFPGQGVTNEREGRTWYERSDAVRRLVEAVARHTGTSPDRLLGHRSGGLLPTELLEPLHTALCLGIHEDLIGRGVRADIVAGHSLGEIPACAAAGGCTAEEAIALAAERGRLMARAAAKRPGGMLALRGVERETVTAAVAFACERGAAAIAAHNAPRQWVISGEWGALRRLATRYPAFPIPVGGPWHSAVLADAAEEFLAASLHVVSSPLRVPLVSNRTGAIVRDVGELPKLLAEQFTHPVEWARTMTTIAEFGVTDIVTVGAGRVLQGLVRLNWGTRGCLHGTDTAGELDRTAEALAR